MRHWRPIGEDKEGDPEDGAEHVADKGKGEYEVAYFPPYVKVMRDDRHRRGWCQRSESAVGDKVSTTWQLAPGAGTYTLSVAVVETIVIHDLCYEASLTDLTDRFKTPNSFSP